MKAFRIFGYVAVCLAVVGCAPSELAPEELIAFVENPDNRLRQAREAGDYRFELQYKPSDYVALKETSRAAFSPAEHAERTRELGSIVQFNLRLQHSHENDFLSSSNEDPQDYFDRLEYYSLFANENMLLVTGSDTLYPSLYHFEHTYNLAPYNTVVLGFEHPAPLSSDLTFIYDDHVLGTGPVKFSLDIQDLEAIPALKTS